jgi:hypothetical protein
VVEALPIVLPQEPLIDEEIPLHMLIDPANPDEELDNEEEQLQMGDSLGNNHLNVGAVVLRAENVVDHVAFLKSNSMCSETFLKSNSMCPEILQLWTGATKKSAGKDKNVSVQWAPFSHLS